jgi:WD40 repeat protein
MKHNTNLHLLLILAGFLALNQATSAKNDEDLVLTFKGHKGPVYCLDVHPDGNLIATGGEDRLILLWNPADGEIRNTLEGHGKPVKYLSFSDDGRYLLSAASTEIRIWDLKNGTWRDYHEHVTHVYNLDFNSDASRFLSTSLKSKFIEWDRLEGEVIRSFEKHSKSCLAVTYSPDDRLIASGSLDRTIKLWDAATAEVIHDISAHGENILSLDFSPNGDLLASASMDQNIKIWHVETGRIHSLLSGHGYAVVYVRFSPEGKYLLSASYDRTAKLWEVATGNCIYTFVDQEEAIHAADFTADGRQVITCSNDGTVNLYEISPRFIAEHYYFSEIQREMQESGLFGDRRKGEKKDQYQSRIKKAAKFRQELHEKYYRLHMEEIGQ